MPPARSAGGRPSRERGGRGGERFRKGRGREGSILRIILAETTERLEHHIVIGLVTPETANPTMLTAEEAKRHVEAAEQIRGASGLQVNYPVAAQVAVHSSMQTSPAS